MIILDKLFPKDPLIRTAEGVYSITKFRTPLDIEQIKSRVYTNIRDLIDAASVLNQTATIVQVTSLVSKFKSEIKEDFSKEGYSIKEVTFDQTYYLYISWDITKSDSYEETRLGTSDVQV